MLSSPARSAESPSGRASIPPSSMVNGLERRYWLSNAKTVLEHGAGGSANGPAGHQKNRGTPSEPLAATERSLLVFQRNPSENGGRKYAVRYLAPTAPHAHNRQVVRNSIANATVRLAREIDIIEIIVAVAIEVPPATRIIKIAELILVAAEVADPLDP